MIGITLQDSIVLEKGEATEKVLVCEASREKDQKGAKKEPTVSDLN